LEINTLRALTEKEKGELDFWIDHILGFGCVRESGRSFHEQWSAGASGRIAHYKSKIPELEKLGWSTWVDVGCGPYPTLLHAPTGVMSIMIDPLMKHYFHHALVPPNATRPNRLFLEGFVENLPLADECADVVMCLNALDHVDQPWVGLTELTRILKVGGYLILEVDVGGETDFMHPHSFSAEELAANAARVGLNSLYPLSIATGEKRRTGAELYYGFYQRRLRAPEIYPPAPPPLPGSLRPLLVREGIAGYNILRFWDSVLGDKYYAILQSDGPFEYDRLVRGGYDRCIEGSTVEEVETRIVEATRLR